MTDELSALTPWAAEFRYEESTAAELDRDRALELVRSVRIWADGAGASAA